MNRADLWTLMFQGWMPVVEGTQLMGALPACFGVYAFLFPDEQPRRMSTSYHRLYRLSQLDSLERFIGSHRIRLPQALLVAMKFLPANGGSRWSRPNQTEIG